MTAPPADAALLDEAVHLTREAGVLTQRWFRAAELAVHRKDDGTPVTEADRSAEHLIREHLADRHPDDAILGEEHGAEPGSSGRRWIIDPIDGTKAFSHGVPTYTNLLALEDEHGIALGVVNLPALGETVYAGRGLGCWVLVHGEDEALPARVSERVHLADAYVTTSGYEHWTEPWLAGVRGAGMHLRTWGDGWGYALLATGRVDAMVDPQAAPWDLAPMPVIVHEAGGRFSDHRGEDRIDGGSGIATNGHVHDALLGVLEGPNR